MLHCPLQRRQNVPPRLRNSVRYQAHLNFLESVLYVVRQTGRTFEAHLNVRAHHVDGINRQWLSCNQAVSLNFVFHRLRAGGSA